MLFYFERYEGVSQLFGFWCLEYNVFVQIFHYIIQKYTVSYVPKVNDKLWNKNKVFIFTLISSVFVTHVDVAILFAINKCDSDIYI